ncbi:hypothetical protein PV04_09008 [Phialophora macrospora]|uniref:Major facilitator superfamily (MFS) profile domain-containing protein n=1 Tax=Phialophora macrospora TaxID=1851006 RepID=A0A0D2F7T7_9EURO|nr:hypothetical protein PV04_09008 [Phialophora macrospora]
MMTMASSRINENQDISSWPPGTIQIETLRGAKDGQIILHPTPSADPNDPLNWSKLRKSINFGLTCYYTLMVFVLVDIATVIYGPLMAEFGFSVEVLNDGFGANTAGLAVGCVLFIPFALKFGRRPVYLVSFALSLAVAIWQANLRTAGDVYGANVVSGLGGSIAETICQMTISDLFYVHQRATANGVYLGTVTTGAFLGPVAAGYIADSQGWRWIWWWTAILLGVGLVACIFLYEETKYIPLIDADTPSSAGAGADGVANEVAPTSAHGEEASLGNKDLESGVREYAAEALAEVTTRTVRMDIPPKSYSQRLRLLTVTPGGFDDFVRHAWQPFVILFTTPAVAYTALIYGSLLAWFTVVLSVFSIYLTYPPYNFSTSAVGLMNLAPFIGSLLGSAYGGPLSDFHILRLSQKNNGIYEPEMRFWLALPWIVVTPLSLLMFGLCLAHGLHWISLAIALAIFGTGLNVFSDVALTYLIDSYRDIVGDSLVAVTFVRNALATAVAMSLSNWIEGTGLSAVFIICAVVSAVVLLTTIPMMIWGKSFRVRTAKKYVSMAQKQFNANR